MPRQETIARALSSIQFSEDSDINTACVIIPTYNEARNIGRLLDALFFHLKAQPTSRRPFLHVLVVDDNSPDGTAGIVQGYMQNNPHVRLLLRQKKEGLGAAYIAGMQHAIEAINPDVVIEMDADMSHSPADVFRLINCLREGHDFALGSRYVDGGRLPEKWGLHRKIVSELSNFATKSLLGLSCIEDCTGGFRAIRTSILKKIDLGTLKVRGYAFQAVILEAAIRQGARVAEIPISFLDRQAGKSKMTYRDLIEGGIVLGQIRIGKLLAKKRIAQAGPLAMQIPGNGRVKPW